ncbi:MAG: hypothetical protein U0S50_01805 [Sphingopyxis sp.]|uniref:hypothetical protein n=1 Tax=Sphingopyxis sp. TaxID=1908224 RepID=UPI002ABA0133|nr:hypothetical protein [Sphingopyxis sp.]MDZ3830536.1 hypothetical protein [Sphingopyxis sp.]
MKRAAALLAALCMLPGCAATSAPPASNPQDAFFADLTARCGKAYAGRLVSDQQADAAMQDKAMVMHIRSCTSDRIEIPFHIAGLGPDGNWDRSRTWIISRTPTGLRLKHDHRHADGEADTVTYYGGDTADAGTPTRQSFPVDAESIAMFGKNGLTASVTNEWAVETNATDFAYEMRREGRHFRVAFDYDKPVAPPPAPWGW